MPKFRYKASDRSGRILHDSLMADSRTEAIQELRGRGLTPLDIVETESGLFSGKKISGFLQEMQLKSPSQLDIAIFFRQLSISVKAGVPLRDSLENIAAEMDQSTLRQSIVQAIQDLHEGQRFATALERNNIKNVFSPLVIGLSQVAEETGTLGETMEELADYLEAMVKMKSEIRSKMAYPTFMTVAFILIMLVATFKLFPMFEESFSTLGADLPPLTVNVFAANRMALDMAPYAFGILGLIITGLAVLRTTPSGRRQFDGALLKLPLLGPLLYKIGSARFCRTLAITATGGVALLDGLEISTCVISNQSLKYKLNQVREYITNGNSFGSSVRETGALGGLVTRMIEIGEESGQLPLVLNKVSEIYDQEVNQAISKLTSLIEPSIIVLFAVFVTVMVLALYMPVFSMGSSL